MSSGTNTERITQNNGIITDNNTAIDNFKTAINNLPSRDNNAKVINPENTGFTNKNKCIDYIEEVKDIDFSYFTGNVAGKGAGFFSGLTSLKNVSELKNTNNMTSFQTFFYECRKLENAPTIDTSNNANMQYTFGSCSSLKNIPIYDTSNVLNFNSTFNLCPLLTNESLNNILYMLAHATAYINQGTNMTLAYVGLSQTQATTCQTLSNWQDCVTAGWTTGY